MLLSLQNSVRWSLSLHCPPSPPSGQHSDSPVSPFILDYLPHSLQLFWKKKTWILFLFFWRKDFVYRIYFDKAKPASMSNVQSVSSEAGELGGLSTGAQLLVFSSYRIKVKLQPFPSPLSTFLTASPQITASWTHHTEFMSLSDFGSLSLSTQTSLPRGTSALLHLQCLHNLHSSPQRVPTANCDDLLKSTSPLSSRCLTFPALPY